MDEKFWRSSPKQFCDDSHIATMGGVGNMVLLSIFSGGNAQVFALTPEHAKRFSQMLNYNLEQIEKTTGSKIQVEEWTSERKSPLQLNDIQGDKK